MIIVIFIIDYILLLLYLLLLLLFAVYYVMLLILLVVFIIFIAGFCRLELFKISIVFVVISNKPKKCSITKFICITHILLLISQCSVAQHSSQPANSIITINITLALIVITEQFILQPIIPLCIQFLPQYFLLQHYIIQPLFVTLQLFGCALLVIGELLLHSL